MSNLSRIAMLAQIGSGLMDDTRAADERIKAFKSAGFPDDCAGVLNARAAMDRACRAGADTASLMLAQKPVDLPDVLSLMLAIMLAVSEIADAIQDYANGDASDAAQAAKLAELVDDAASNIAVLLARSNQPHTAYEQHVVGLLAQRLDPAPLTIGREA